jgi:pyruvate-formate lyase-activating enzyme
MYTRAEARKDTARVVLTTECRRSCPYCVNKYDGVLGGARPFKFMHDMVAAARDYDAVCLTGGEPMAIIPDHTVAFAETLKHVYPDKKVYCYVADYADPKALLKLLNVVDGVHYTLHASSDYADIMKFYYFQSAIRLRRGSHRLYIHPHILYSVVIVPGRFSRIESKPWMKPGECKLPPNEDLYVWRR